MKIATRIGLVSCLFLAVALATRSEAAEYYRYKDPQGNLIISNKPPPPGSTIIRKYELPEAPEQQVPEGQQGADPQPNGPPESPPQQSKSR